MFWLTPRLRTTDRRNAFRRSRFEALEPRCLLSGTPPTVVDVSLSSTEWSNDFVGYLADAGLGDNGYSIPVGSTVQAAALPWTNLDQIAIEFSEDVHVDRADLALSGVNTVSYEFTDFRYDPQARLAIWTLAAPLAAERLMIDLDADGMDPVRDLDGNLLDGEWTNQQSTFASGDGTAGGDFEFTLNTTNADADGSGFVNYYDYIYVRSLEGTAADDAGYIATRDIDGSGVIDEVDWQHVLDHLWEGLPTGDPAGLFNDAPTTSGFDLVDIDDDTIDVAISLLAAFNDAEDGSSGLAYSIVDNNAPSLFDSASINAASGELVLNTADGASGRAQIEIRATDSAGLSVSTTVTVDVNRNNQAPEIYNFHGAYVGFDTWFFSGHVTDPDDELDGFIVELFGLIDERVAVDENGYFELVIDIEGTGDVFAQTEDPHGLVSNTPMTEIFIT